MTKSVKDLKMLFEQVGTRNQVSRRRISISFNVESNVEYFEDQINQRKNQLIAKRQRQRAAAVALGIADDQILSYDSDSFSDSELSSSSFDTLLSTDLDDCIAFLI